MKLNKLRTELAVTLLAFAVVSAVDSASAATAVEYGLVFAFGLP
jgi:hypothetical protein